MRLETFFEKFDQFADAPDAVAKMRELVRHLAVQGKLVDQQHDEGNAAQLLAAISRERDSRAAKLRTPEQPASADGDGHPFQIPSKWAWTQLGNIALQIQYGYTASADPSATDTRMLRITDIQNNRVDWPSVPGCGGEILLCVVGATIGRLGVAPASWAGANIARAVARIAPIAEVNRDYLLLVLRSPLIQSYFATTTRTLAQPTLNVGAIEQTPIPLPPLAEQRRIVAKVDQLMALVDALETQLAASRTTAANLLSALVTELTTASANGAPHASPGQRPAKASAKPIKG